MTDVKKGNLKKSYSSEFILGGMLIGAGIGAIYGTDNALFAGGAIGLGIGGIMAAIVNLKR